MFRGKIFTLVNDVLGVNPFIAGSVRWYVMWEQYDQINRSGVEAIMRRVIPTCVEQKYSGKKYKETYRYCKKPPSKEKVIVEFAIVAQMGKPFCVATYNMEAEAPMTLMVYMIFDTVNELCNGVFQSE